MNENDASQQSQPRSSMARAAGFEPAKLGSIPSGASTWTWGNAFNGFAKFIVMGFIVIAVITVATANIIVVALEQEEWPVVPVTEVITCIRWVDITGDTTWVSEDELIEPAEVMSCGIFVKENDDNLWLAMDKALEDSTYNGTGVFPKGVIKSRKEIELTLE